MLHIIRREWHRACELWEDWLWRWEEGMREWAEIINEVQNELNIRLRRVRSMPCVLLRKFLVFRAQFKKLICYRHMMWLDEVGSFYKDQVFTCRSLKEHVTCVSTNGRFMYAFLPKKHGRVHRSYGVEIIVVDLLLGEHYSLKVDSSSLSAYGFIGFYALKDSVLIFLHFHQEGLSSCVRQVVFNIDHVKRTAECLGYRNLQFSRRAFSSLNCCSRYCYFSDGSGRILRFAKNPAEADNLLPTATLFLPFAVYFPFNLRYIYSTAEDADEVLCPVLHADGRLKLFPRGGSYVDALGQHTTIRAGSTVFLRCSFQSQTCTVQTSSFSSEVGFPLQYEDKKISSVMVYAQLGPEVVFGEALCNLRYTTLSRTALLIGRYVSKWISSIIWLIKVFTPHSGFISALGDFFLGYISNSLLEELCNHIRSSFPSVLYVCGSFNLNSFQWKIVSQDLNPRVCMLSQENPQQLVTVNIPTETDCVSIIQARPFVANVRCSLAKLVEMKLQCYPNVALRNTGRELVRLVYDGRIA